MRGRNNAIMRETCSQRRIIVTLRVEGKKKSAGVERKRAIKVKSVDRGRRQIIKKKKQQYISDYTSDL